MPESNLIEQPNRRDKPADIVYPFAVAPQQSCEAVEHGRQFLRLLRSIQVPAMYDRVTQGSYAVIYLMERHRKVEPRHTGGE